MRLRRPPLTPPLLALLALLLVLGSVAGMVRAMDGPGPEEWDEMAQDDLRRMHRDLGDSVALLRASGFEIRTQDVTRWLRHLGRGGYLAGSATSMRLYRHDPVGDSFLVVARGEWHDAVTEVASFGQACGRMQLTGGVEAPLELAEAPCPEGVERSSPVPACPVGGCSADRTLLARTVLRVQRARWDAPPGAPVTLSPRPVPTRPVGDLRESSVELRCAPGTRDIGGHDAYVAGRRVPVRLCAIPDLPSAGAESTRRSGHHVPGARGQAIVNARVSGAVGALVEAARDAGLRLAANSSFRTMRHQRHLCRDDPGCRAGEHILVAPPGYSQHQLGVAIDFDGTAVTATRSCERRAEDPTSRVWRFLHDHAGRFGFRQYAAESWHWDALRAPGRCGRQVP